MTKKITIGADSQEKPDQGICCRNCGCRHVPVYTTRKTHRGVLRYRRCRHCGATIITTEIQLG